MLKSPKTEYEVKVSRNVLSKSGILYLGQCRHYCK